MPASEMPVRIQVVRGDAMNTEADVLVLKHAQTLYGVDKQVAATLPADEVRRLPPVDGFCLLPSSPQVAATSLLFLGVPTLRQFRYREIRLFARRALQALAGERPDAQTVAITLHGAGYGLDEAECFRSEVAGLADAVATGDRPAQLKTILVVEQNAGRAERLSELLIQLLPGAMLDADYGALRRRVGETRAEELQTVGYDSGDKPYAFVAMPINEGTEDAFHYGIRQAVSRIGLLCERIDRSPATGDIVDRIKRRIETSKYVIADLTGKNVNVYLEVGFAWGCRVPTILLVQADQLHDLGFDVKGQRCVVYGTIRDLEKKLIDELAGLAH